MKESKKMTRTTATAETGASAPTEESFLRLLGRVRHDLRSPLGHIIGFGEILLEEAAASGADGLLEGLRSILQVANEALGRVNAVLNAGPPEARSEELIAFSVHLGEAANQMRNVAEQLAGQCDRDGRKTFSEDFHRIAGSAAELFELAQTRPQTLRSRTAPTALEPAMLPVEPRKAAGAGGGERSDPERILVVDDDPRNCEILRQRLSPLGYKLVLAANGQEALARIAAEPVDLLLLDINMPGLDGLETCRQLKRDQATQDIPVIFITADDSAQSLVDGFRAGGVDFITKPFKAEEVLVRVETHLKIHRLTGTLTRQNDQLTRLNAELQEEVSRRQQAEQSLSLIEKRQAERFHTGGTLGADAPSYVERRADEELLGGLLRGEFCYVLTCRQMGKSSLMVRTARRLRERGCQVVSLDLTAIGQNLTPEQWYGGLIAFMSWELELENEIESFWLHHGRLGPVQRFFAAIRTVVVKYSPRPMVIFVDELDMLRSLPFSTDEFLAAIREAYNARSEDPDLNRLRFCLLGVATPSELIQDEHMTPFNVGKRIELEDFSPQEVAPLARGLGRDHPMAAELMSRIYYWTSGHPYLTQKLCQGIVADESVRTAEAVDELCYRILLCPKAQEEDDNLIFVRDRLQRGKVDLRQLLDLYSRARNGQPVAADESNPLVAVLRLSGITRSVDGFLQVRNRIYGRVFDRTWIETMLARTE